MDEEPDEHLQVGLFAAERETSADQVGQSEAQGGVETLDVLGPTNAVQCAKNDAFIRAQAVCMTDRVQVGCG